MKKRLLVILSLILTMALVFALPGCKSGNTQDSGESDTEVTEIDQTLESGNSNDDNGDVTQPSEDSNDDLNDDSNDDNTGDDNTGDDNTGDDNTGDDNTGDDNTGDDNTGDDNTGDDNTSDDNTSDDNTGGDNDDIIPPVENVAPIRNGNKVTFGSYPQSKVDDSTLSAELSGLATEWISSKGLWYSDVELDGTKFRGVKTTQSGVASWFKYESVIWTILEENDGKAFVLCDMIIDAMAYDDNNNNYENSTIRAWLNDEFINTAFSELEQEFILTTLVKNDKESTGYANPRFSGENTLDKIFLLSRVEVKAYGFNSDGSVQDSTRKKQATAYAISQINGVYDATSGAWWWLRTPAPHATDTVRADLAHTIKVNGTINNSVVSTATGGVLPAMWITFNK